MRAFGAVFAMNLERRRTRVRREREEVQEDGVEGAREEIMQAGASRRRSRGRRCQQRRPGTRESLSIRPVSSMRAARQSADRIRGAPTQFESIVALASPEGLLRSLMSATRSEARRGRSCCEKGREARHRVKFTLPRLEFLWAAVRSASTRSRRWWGNSLEPTTFSPFLSLSFSTSSTSLSLLHDNDPASSLRLHNFANSTMKVSSSLVVTAALSLFSSAIGQSVASKIVQLA